MKFRIHRGTKEIGGSCVEVWTENTRILLDFGMPLVEKDGKEFDFRKYKDLTSGELVEQGVLPNIEGLYNNSKNTIDGVIISHPHQDHYGLSNYINNEITFYLGAATHKIIEINKIFTPQEIDYNKTVYFVKNKAFPIGDILITPFLADHSAFDAYSFLIEADGKKMFYSGDFRSHGRKSNSFYWFTHNGPQNVDYLLLEGTSVGRSNKTFKSELEIEKELTGIFKQPGKTNLIYTSGQNIDRLVSVYKACKKANKIFVVDIYIAKILKVLSEYARIPYPSDAFRDVKVFYPEYTCRRLRREGYNDILSQFRKFEITASEIDDLSDRIVMTIRPSMLKDLEQMDKMNGGNLIYSMWEGYLEKTNTKKFIKYLSIRKFSLHKIHTSGHADINTLKKFVKALNPQKIVPIHTFSGNLYKDIFTIPVVLCKDGETVVI